MTTTTWLEMRSPDDLRAPPPRTDVAIVQVRPPDPALNARLYAAVGAGYRWVDRLRWSEDEWRAYVARPDLETWLMSAAGEPAGYFELIRHVDDEGRRASLAEARPALDDERRRASFAEARPALDDERRRSVEIAYFGLMPGFIGRGLGATLLAAAVRRGWALPAARVWLHTSSHDHPNALANYLARGFRIYRLDVS